jgi:hypothetical protein
MTRRSPSTTARVAPIALATLTACKLGGPSADPTAYLFVPDDAALDDATTGGSSSGADVESLSTGPGFADSESTFPSNVDDGDTEEQPATCSDASAVAVCDPVHNTGCNPFQQCDVDPGQTSTPTGLCLFNGGQADAGSCSMSLVSETCPPKSTCVSGACRQLCGCDSDCAAGECCSDTGGPPGFLLCKTCP